MRWLRLNVDSRGSSTLGGRKGGGGNAKCADWRDRSPLPPAAGARAQARYAHVDVSTVGKRERAASLELRAPRGFKQPLIPPEAERRASQLCNPPRGMKLAFPK